MNLVKNVGDKLDKKMKSGDIKESELLEEASNMFNNMKNMPGMGDNNNMQDLFNNINIPNLMKNMGMMPNNAKFNQNAFSSMMDKNIQTSKMRERMRSKLEKNQENKNTKQSENSEYNNQQSGNPPSGNVQTNIQKNLDYILNQKNSSNELNYVSIDFMKDFIFRVLKSIISHKNIDLRISDNEENIENNGKYGSRGFKGNPEGGFKTPHLLSIGGRRVYDF